jgi:hypothetical protein
MQSQISLLVLNSNEVLRNSNANFQIEIAGIIYPAYTFSTFSQALTVRSYSTQMTRLHAILHVYWLDVAVDNNADQRCQYHC